MESVHLHCRRGTVTLPISHLYLNLTSRCSLRCVYCTRGNPHGEEVDLGQDSLEKIFAFLEEHTPDCTNVGCYTETTSYDGWEGVLERLLSLPTQVNLISNFSRLLTEAQLEVISRCRFLQVSLDTLDLSRTQAVRRGADVRTILYNPQRVRAAAIQYRRSTPQITWICVPSEENLPGLAEYVACAKACGVHTLVIQHVMKFSGSPAEPEDLLDLPSPRFEKAWALLKEALELADAIGLQVEFKNREHFEARNSGTTLGRCTMEMALGRSTYYGQRVPEGHTRICLAPWTSVVLSEGAELYPCAICGIPLARLQEHATLLDAHRSPALEAWRQNLLEGRLGEDCRNCISAPIGTQADLVRMVQGLPKGIA